MGARNVPAPPLIYGRYQLLELLARGGMAEVFKAKSHGVEGFEKVLVIKRILPELSENLEFVDMFINEAKLSVHLNHANVVQVFDLGRTDDRYFIAMEYVAGADLATIFRRGKRHEMPLPHTLAAYIVSEVAKALDYAHRRRDADLRPLGIVHRDVSPQNVLLSFEGEVKLTDFGIAKARSKVAQRTQEGVLKGKYAYMAPEQAQGEDVDARTDIFALGVILYEALSGSNPFTAGSSYETLKNVRAGLAPPIAVRAPHVPPTLAKIVHRALQPSPSGRYQSAGVLHQDLMEFIYSSEKRAGGSELSLYLERLLDVAHRSHHVELAEQGVDLRNTFELEPTVVPRHRRRAAEPDATIVDTPRLSTSTVTTLQPEERDVTILTLGLEQATSLSAAVVSAIERSGGELEPLAGRPGWFRAIFGVVEQDGRDSEYAGRCALAIADATNTRTGSAGAPLRMGLHSGRAIVGVHGKLERDALYDALVAGALAAAEASRPGQTIVTSDSQRSLRRLFHLRFFESEGYHALLGERAISEARGRFVGRMRELRRVGELLAAAATGERRVIEVVGAPGSGKTRLLHETLRRLRLGGHDAAMYVAQLERHGPETPLLAVQEMLRAILAIDDFDGEAEIQEQVLRLRELGLPRSERAALAQVLAAPLPELLVEEGNPRLKAGISRLALKLSQDRLTVFAFDGVEAADKESLMLLGEILRIEHRASIALIVTHRPEVELGWGDLPGVERIRLNPLPDEDISRLVGELLGVDEVPMELLREVTVKSGGNPLYVEEYLRALGDVGALEAADGDATYHPEVAAVEVPKTLRGIVSSRLARFGPTERHLLQVASVIGGKMPVELLREVTGLEPEGADAGLERLRREGVLTRHGLDEYEFTHDIVAEVLRLGLPIQARRDLNFAVAAALESLYPDRLDELAERIATHLYEAGSRVRAVDYLQRASVRRAAEGSLGAAVHNLVKAIDALGLEAGGHVERQFELYEQVGDLCRRGKHATEGARHMAAAIALAEATGRKDRVAAFAVLRGRLLAQANRFVEARQWLDLARDTATALDDIGLMRDVTMAAAETTSQSGDFGSAVGLLEDSLAHSRELGEPLAQFRCLTLLALAHAAMGELEPASKALSEAERLVADDPDPSMRCEVLTTEALVDYYVGDRESAIDAGRRALELSREFGLEYEAAFNAHYLGENHLRLGDFKRAFAMLSYSYELAKEEGFRRLQHNSMRVLGFLDRAKFGSEAGRQRIVTACQYAQRNGFVGDLVAGRFMLAYVDASEGHMEAARESFREVVRLAAEYGHRHYEIAATDALAAIEAGQPIRLPR